MSLVLWLAECCTCSCRSLKCTYNLLVIIITIKPTLSLSPRAASLKSSSSSYSFISIKVDKNGPQCDKEAPCVFALAGFCHLCEPVVDKSFFIYLPKTMFLCCICIYKSRVLADVNSYI